MAYITGRLQHGRLHGPVRVFGQVTNDPRASCPQKFLNRDMAFIGHMNHGIPTGHCWRGLYGGSWVHGEVDEEGEFTGDEIAYIYNDLKTAFVGKFKEGLMVRL